MKRDNLLIVAASSVVISAFLIILTISQQQTIESLTTELVAQSPLEVEPSPTEALDPFADWQTYQNNRFNYLFKYPSDLHVTGENMGPVEENLHVVLTQGSLFSDPFFAVRIVEEISPTDSFDLTTYVQTSYDLNSNHNTQKEEISQVTVDGVLGYQYLLQSDTFDYTSKNGQVAGGHVLKNDIYKIIYIQDKKHLYEIVFSNSSLYPQVFSTFKFLDQE